MEQNRLLAQLPQSDLEDLASTMHLRTFEPGETIYPVDQLIDSVYFPLTVVASRLAILEDGSTVEVGMVGREGVIGISAYLASGRTMNWTVADIGGTALRMRVGQLTDAVKRIPGLAQLLSADYQDFFTQVTQRAVCRSRHTVMEQLCTWLLMMSDRCDLGDLPLTQEVIARRLGSRRAGITVAANALRKAGAIAYRRGQISIIGRPQLENRACECYGALREHERGFANWERAAVIPRSVYGLSTAA